MDNDYHLHYREGFEKGVRDRSLVPILRPSIAALITESMQRYGVDSERYGFLDGYCHAVESQPFRPTP